MAAYLLASLGGKSDPSASDLEKIIGSVGIDVEADKIKKIISELKGKDLEELIKAGQEKLASVPAGGAAVAAAAPVSGGDAPAAAKKEEKKPEPESESDEDMGFGLFD